MRLLLPLLVTLTSLSAFAETKEIDRTISVSGEAVVMVVPNQAVVTIGVETFDSKLEVASSTNDRVAKKLIQEWKSLGIADANIQTSGVSVEISYLRDSDRVRRTIEGYEVSRSWTVITDNAAMAEKVISTSLANGANSVSEVEFRTTELRKYRDQARVTAIKAAREKADLIASQLGASVGPPRSIGETTNYYSPSRYNRAAMSQNVTSYASDDAPADIGGAVAPGQIAVRASVSVVFDLVVRRPAS